MTRKYNTEYKIVRGCLDLKPRAQRALYDTYVDSMYNTVYRYTFDHQDTQDVLQNAFSKVYRYLHTYDSSKGNLKNWMRKIFVRVAIDFIKKKKINFIDIDEVIDKTTSNFSLSDDMDIDYIYTMIENLPLRDRTIFNLSQIEGYSHKEIAEMLHINEGSSRVYLARTKKRLQSQILHWSSIQIITE